MPRPPLPTRFERLLITIGTALLLALVLAMREPVGQVMVGVILACLVGIWWVRRKK